MSLNLSKNSVINLKEESNLEVRNQILNEICILENKIFGNSSYSEIQIREMLDSPSYYIYTSLDQKLKTEGYIIIYNSIDSLEIMKIAVDFQNRNKNIGTKLLKKVLENSNLNILLEVRESNSSAINFYKKNGFNQISVRKNYYNDNNENAIIMLLDI
ncbi:MAG: ribosomal protein S18-alanine N-acetyltransferase [Fusobacteriaceae bacterium]